MNLTRTSRFLIFTILLFSGMIMMFSQDTEASHFRLGHLNWEHTGDGNEVKFGGFQAWRLTWFSDTETILYNYENQIKNIVCTGISLDFGDNSSPIDACVSINHIDTIEDWLWGEIVDPNGNPIRHTFETKNNNGKPWKVFWSGSARINELEKSGGSLFEVSTLVDLENSPNGSPRTIMEPFYHCPVKECKIELNSLDSNNAELSFRKANALESSISEEPPYKIDSNTGIITWNPGVENNGTLWATSVVLEEKRNNTIIGMVMMDFIIKVSTQYDSSLAPKFETLFESKEDREFNINTGDTIKLPVQCKGANTDDSINISPLNRPENSKWNVIKSGNIASGIFEWTPTKDQISQIRFNCKTDENVPASLPITYTIAVANSTQSPQLRDLTGELNKNNDENFVKIAIVGGIVAVIAGIVITIKTGILGTKTTAVTTSNTGSSSSGSDSSSSNTSQSTTEPSSNSTDVSELSIDIEISGGIE